jgi:organic hydroperoxide reductase OsmC/OhrA
MPDEPHTYRTSLRWQENRKAALSAPGLPDLQVATPPEFPGGHPGIWSPEHLFVASAEACLMTTFLAIAENSKLAFSAYSSSAEGTLEKTPEGFMVTRIALKARVVISDPAVADRAKRIVEKAEQACLISKSMKTKIILEVEVLVVPA